MRRSRYLRRGWGSLDKVEKCRHQFILWWDRVSLLSGVEVGGGGVRTSIHTIYICKPIAIAVFKMLGAGGS